MVRKHLAQADEQGYLRRPFPHHLNRRILPSQGLREGQVDFIMGLFAYYGISDHPHKWPLLSMALVSGLTTAFRHMERAPGRPRAIKRPDLLYDVIKAIQSVACGHPNPITDPDLRSLVQSIGGEDGIRECHPSRRLTQICERLRFKQNTLCEGVATATIRSTYYAQRLLEADVRKLFDKVGRST